MVIAPWIHGIFFIFKKILCREGALIFYTDPPLLKMCCPAFWNAVDYPQISAFSGITIKTESCLAQGPDASQGNKYKGTDPWRGIKTWPFGPTWLLKNYSCCRSPHGSASQFIPFPLSNQDSLLSLSFFFFF